MVEIGRVGGFYVKTKVRLLLSATLNLIKALS